MSPCGAVGVAVRPSSTLVCITQEACKKARDPSHALFSPCSPSGARALRRQLAQQYDLGSREPDIQVWNVNLRGDRSLTMRHFEHQRRTLHGSIDSVLEHVATLWGFPVRLERQNIDGTVQFIGEKQTGRRRED